jgi:hypothetical protein
MFVDEYRYTSIDSFGQFSVMLAAEDWAGAGIGI